MLVLEREMPVVHAELGELLRDREARLEMDGEGLGVSFAAGRFRIVDDAPDPFIDLRSDRRAVLEVIGGELTLEDAVWQERIVLRGELDDLILFHDALMLYLQGAVRCPSFPWLLGCYRAGTVPSREACEGQIAKRTVIGVPERFGASR